MKQFFGKKSRNALGMVLIVSLALHVVVILIFGTIKFVSEVLREETVFEAAPIEPAPQQKREYQVNLEQRAKSTPPPRPPTIVVNNPSEMSIPALDIDVNVDTASVYSSGGSGFGGGLSGVRDMVVDVEFFGAEASGTNFAVLMDMTHSGRDVFEATRAELLKTLKTIKSGNANFMLIYFGGRDAGHVAGNKDFTESDFWFPRGISGRKWLEGGGGDINKIMQEMRAVDPGDKSTYTGSESEMDEGGIFFRLGTQYWGAMNAAFKLKPPPSTVFFLVEPRIALPNVKTVKRAWEWYEEFGRRKPKETEVHFIVGKPKEKTNVEAVELMVNLIHGGNLSDKEIQDLITYTE